MYQRCPLCNGSGQDPTIAISSDTVICPVCGGAKIINEATGKPPKHEGDKCPHDPSKTRYC